MLKFPTCKIRFGCADQVLCWVPISLAALEVSYTYSLGKETSSKRIYYLGKLDEFRPVICCEGRDPEHQLTLHLNLRKQHVRSNCKNRVSLPCMLSPHQLPDLYFNKELETPAPCLRLYRRDDCNVF